MADEELKEVQDTTTEEVVKEAPKKVEEAQEEQKTEVKEETKKEATSETEEVVSDEPATDWRDKELRKKHAQNKEKDRLIAERDQRIADLEVLAQRGTEPPKEGDPPRVQVKNMSQDEVKAAARELRAQERYQEDLANTNSSGEKTYGPKWAAALDNLSTLGTVEPDTMLGILATDNPAKVLYELGSKPQEMQRIMELPPHRRQTEFVKLSLKTEPKPKPSAAPEPVDQLRSHVTPSTELRDSDSDDDWYAKWEAKRAAKRKAG